MTTDFIDETIADAQLVFTVEKISDDYYACQITSPFGEMKRKLRMKPGYEPPTLGGMLYHYALIAQNLSEYDDMLEWADDSSRDLAEPETIKEFKQMVEDDTDLRKLLSEKIFQNLLAGLAISQAINKAMPR
jgi:hypothetical protein